jgi:hypothetical protein
VSERMIGAINQLGNEFILIFLFRRAGLVQPHGRAISRISFIGE